MRAYLEGTASILFVGFVIWLFMDQPLFYRVSGERYIYPMTCQIDDTNWVQPTSQSFLSVSCPKGSEPYTLVRESYIANQESQHVVGLTLGLGFIRRYDDCEVYDADNWYCRYSGSDSGKYISMQNGEMWNSALRNVYVSKITWYRYRWTR